MVNYYNRNKAKSKVMGPGSGPNGEEIHKGLYKSQMNTNTSHVNWDEVAENKAKIAEYKQRMLE